MEFKKYQRKGLSEMVQAKLFTGSMDSVSVSEPDKALSNEEFMEGYIARNPANHEDMWYVAKKYFDENLIEAPEPGHSPGPFGLLHLGRGSFGEAIFAMKKGQKVARSGWNGKNMHLWLLPDASVKKEWIKDPMLLSVFGDRDELNCLGSIRMLTATGEVLTGWLASQSDMLAEDWCIID